MWSLAKLKSWSDASCSHGREDAEKGVNQPEPSFQLHSIVRSSSSHRPSVSSLSVSSLSPAIHKDRHSTSIRMPSLSYENTSTTSLCPLLSSVSGKIGTAQPCVSESRNAHPLPPSSSVSSEAPLCLRDSQLTTGSCLLALPSRNYFVGLDFILFVSVT